jgi:hypothetical protein
MSPRISLRRVVRFCHAYLCLLRIHRVLHHGGFTAAKGVFLRPWRPGNTALDPNGTTVGEIAWAVETACVWQWRRTVCLHRSLAAYCLLRAARGRPVHITGVMMRPFASHAWTEVGGCPVADSEMEAVRYHYRPILCLPDHTDAASEPDASTVRLSSPTT